MTHNQVHADRTGTVVIPDDAVPRPVAAIAQLFRSGRTLREAVRDRQTDFARFATVRAAIGAPRA